MLYDVQMWGTVGQAGSAIGSFVAVAVALSIASRKDRREDKQKEREREAIRKALLVGIRADLEEWQRAMKVFGAADDTASLDTILQPSHELVKEQTLTKPLYTVRHFRDQIVRLGHPIAGELIAAYSHTHALANLLNRLHSLGRKENDFEELRRLSRKAAAFVRSALETIGRDT